MVKEDWEIEYEKKQKRLSVGISKLSNEQIESIDKAIVVMFDILHTIGETYDIDLAQVRELNDVAWGISHMFQYEKRHKHPNSC